jgi:ATP-binding cassette, subfamily B, heavy metal transporter
MIFSEQVYLIKKLYSYIWPKDWGIRLRLIGAIILLLMTILLNIGVPLVFRETINAISKAESPIFIAEVLLIAYGVLWTLSKALDQVRLIIFNRVVERGVRLLSLNLFDHLNHLSLDFHTKRKTGVIVSIIDRVKHSFAMLVCGNF